MIVKLIMKRFPLWPATLLAAAVILASGSAGAQTNNLLSNGNFNAGAADWSTFTYGSGAYASFEIPGVLAGTTPTTWPSGSGTWPGGAGTNAAGTGPLYDGSLQLTVGANSGPAGGYAWQIVAGAPNVQYTITCEAGAQNWWLPSGEIRLWFLDTNSVAISSNFVETCLSVNNPALGIAHYDTGVPYQNWTNTAVSPVGTAYIKVELCNPNGTGSAWFDDVVLTAPINPPVIGKLYPDGTVLLQNTNTLAFSVTSGAPINSSGVSVTINGVNVSSNLTITGSGTTNLSVSYPGLKTNQLYTAVISVTDTVHLNSFKTIVFDTYAPTFTWEAEDYDFNSGEFINNPILSATPTTGSYNGVQGNEGIDYHNWVVDGPTVYRPSDPVSTSVSGDTPRKQFTAAAVPDYIIGYFDGAGFLATENQGLDGYQPQEWLNYTRTFAPGTYNIYARIAGGNGGNATIPFAEVTSGQGTSAQITTNLGVFNFPANNWGAYQYVPVTDPFGNNVRFPLSGTTTLRVSAGSGANINFFMVVPADNDTPTITGVYPDGSTLEQGTNRLTFTASSSSHSIAQSNVVVTLNGVTNTSLSFSGSTASWNVSVPLALNVTNYAAVISVTDNLGNNHSTTVYFDTFNPASYDIEAEDYDFGGGQFIDNPVITSVAESDSYFDQAPVTDGVDESYGAVEPPLTADYHFRANDYGYVATSICSDTPTRAVLAAQLTNSLAFNYNVAWWSTNAWLNYTHHYPTGNYNVYARLAGNPGNTNLVQLNMVAPSASSLGTFVEVGNGYNDYSWIPLINTNNNQIVAVTLGGLATLRATSLTGNVNANSYLLVPIITAVPLQYSYAGGLVTLSWTNPALHLQAQTNGLTGAWSNYPGGGTSPVQLTVDRAKAAVFFRLSN
jgi:hypothetical protein